MASIGDTTRPAFAYDQATDTWVPVGVGPHSHTPAAIGAISSSLVTAKGDLIVATGSGVVVAQPVGTDGQVLTADSTQADGVKWATPAAGGKVLQVVTATTTTPTSITTTTFTDTTLTASITPTSATSKILILVSQFVYYSSGADQGFGARLMRGATSIYSCANNLGHFYIYNGSNNEGNTTYSISYLDSPSTTSAITYKTQGRANFSSQTVNFNFSNNPASIILMEIGA